ncbi:hypothetical protein CVS30_03890 [Arthrobacter psychrolactophilus]|uniref:lysozyme n=1 Tax=Arthrobacter psychrolactophilus TaxID=92442 RepID=A0A2V5J9B7_9MICC|nr:cell wall-binding repeat-containing protein [Arthrobacter psychrolactophilus]PYI39810.1 hypothetical protein CVS30_03890 [Arthrobacter psychrolactophilus]
MKYPFTGHRVSVPMRTTAYAKAPELFTMVTVRPLSPYANTRARLQTALAVAGTGLLALSLTAVLGISSAIAAPTSPETPKATVQFTELAMSVETTSPETATQSPGLEDSPETADTTLPADVEQSSAAPEPAVSVESPADVATFGAYMGIGLAKEIPSEEQLLRGTQAASPLSASAANPLASATPPGILGMDVSGWQADSATHSVSQVNWTEQWRLGARFVYAKVSEGTSFKDASFSSHTTGAAKVGMLRGGYHFALPNQSDAVTQANYFVTNGGGWSANTKTLPPLLDIENNPYGANCYGLSASAMVSWISSFSKRVQALTGRLPMIYTNYYWWQDCTGNSTAFANQPLHIAAYGTNSPWTPGGWKNYSVWQYSDSGPFAGDSNTWNGTQSSLEAFAAKAEAPTVTPPAPAPVSQPSITSAADLVAADSTGVLWQYPGTGSGGFGTRKQIGKGWTGMRSITVIDWNSDGVLDLLAQRTSGSLAYYKGLAGGGFAAGQQLAESGWASYHMVVGYWINSSKYPQILTRGSNGDIVMWGNPSGNSLGTSTRLTQGWNNINLTMVDFDGDGNQDLLAQYPDGTLRLARSNGYGAFINEGRKVIGSGWNAFTSISVYSDFNYSGSLGLIRRNVSGAINYVSVPGNSAFASATSIGSGWGSFLIAGGEDINLIQPPLAPPAPKAVPGNSKATITVTKNAQGSAATSVTLTSSPGSASCIVTSAAGSCTVTGLSNGISYSFKAVAKNTAGVSPASATSSAVVPFVPVSRIAGADRYATSAAISKATYATGISTVYIASGIDYPDALSGAAAAGKLGAPVLLATTAGLPAATRTELARLKPKKIIILGGTGALSSTVQSQLAQYTGTVTRIAGDDRYATSAAISKASYATGISTVYIASGIDYPDALSGAAAAGKLGAPVLLATTAGLPAATRTELARLKPKKIIILGGTGALSSTVQSQLAQYTGTVTRIAGDDRYATSAAISKASYATGISTVYIASGIDYPDALSGAAAAGKLGAPVLLATTAGLPAATRTELARLKPKKIIILGGTGALSSTVQSQLAQYVP